MDNITGLETLSDLIDIYGLEEKFTRMTVYGEVYYIPKFIDSAGTVVCVNSSGELRYFGKETADDEKSWSYYSQIPFKTTVEEAKKIFIEELTQIGVVGAEDFVNKTAEHLTELFLLVSNTAMFGEKND